MNSSTFPTWTLLHSQHELFYTFPTQTVPLLRGRGGGGGEGGGVLLVIEQYIWSPDGVVWNADYFQTSVIVWIPAKIVVYPRLQQQTKLQVKWCSQVRYSFVMKKSYFEKWYRVLLFKCNYYFYLIASIIATVTSANRDDNNTAVVIVTSAAALCCSFFCYL